LIVNLVLTMTARVPTVEELVRVLDTRSSGAPLDRLRSAVLLADEIHELGDLVLDRVVGEARAAGCSWAEIGRAFGISKQAAQQRFIAAEPCDGLWPEGFTGSARKVLLCAEQHARQLGHNYIGTEHILLGLIDTHNEIAAHALAALGVSAPAVGSHIARLVGQGDTRRWRALGVAPRAKKTLELARGEASRLGHQQVGTEHLLLALTHLNDGVAAHILKDLDADPSRVRRQLAAMLKVDVAELDATPRRRRRRRLLASPPG